MLYPVYTIQPLVKLGCTTGLTTVLNEQLQHEQLFVQPIVKPGCTTSLTTGCIHDTAGCQTGLITGLTTGCIVYTNIYPVVKLGLSNWFDDQFDNRLYPVNRALVCVLM